jgi:hypothetical protein
MISVILEFTILGPNGVSCLQVAYISESSIHSVNFMRRTRLKPRKRGQQPTNHAVWRRNKPPAQRSATVAYELSALMYESVSTQLRLPSQVQSHRSRWHQSLAGWRPSISKTRRPWETTRTEYHDNAHKILAAGIDRAVRIGSLCGA